MFPWPPPPPQPTSTIEEIVVHILHRGRALCPIDGIPRDWPRGHKWLSISDIQSGVEATCERCKASYKANRSLR